VVDELWHRLEPFRSCLAAREYTFVDLFEAVVASVREVAEPWEAEALLASLGRRLVPVTPKPPAAPEEPACETAPAREEHALEPEVRELAEQLARGLHAAAQRDDGRWGGYRVVALRKVVFAEETAVAVVLRSGEREFEVLVGPDRPAEPALVRVAGRRVFHVATMAEDGPARRQIVGAVLRLCSRLAGQAGPVRRRPGPVAESGP
jgi:hypothetical protein